MNTKHENILVGECFLNKFICDELKELESRDVDNLFVMLSENLHDMGFNFKEEELYELIELKLNQIKEK